MAYDKKLHFIAGVCITCVAVLLCYMCYGSTNLWIGLGCGVVAGVAKEVYDEITYGGFDKLDMFYTWAGALLGTGLCYIIF